jgi:hypothetical protein
MHVDMYDCMRSESESELDNQLSGILRKASKQTCILVCLCMYVCIRSKSESASHSSPPQLKGVRVISLSFVLKEAKRKYFICTEGGKHNPTPEQAHKSRYSRHIWHALESVGLHRRYTLFFKMQCTTLPAAGACAHERRTGVVAAEGAAAQVGCPWS